MAQRSFQALAVLAGLSVLALAQDGPDYPDHPGSYALLIGVSQYDHDFWRPLPIYRGIWRT